jgi:hypothetical protein
VFTRDAEGRIHSRKDSGVYFIPMTGYLQARTAAAPSRPATAAGAANVPARTKPAMNGTTAAVAPAKAAAATVAAPGPNALQ